MGRPRQGYRRVGRERSGCFLYLRGGRSGTILEKVSKCISKLLWLWFSLNIDSHDCNLSICMNFNAMVVKWCREREREREEVHLQSLWLTGCAVQFLVVHFLSRNWHTHPHTCIHIGLWRRLVRETSLHHLRSFLHNFIFLLNLSLVYPAELHGTQTRLRPHLPGPSSGGGRLRVLCEEAVSHYL